MYPELEQLLPLKSFLSMISQLQHGGKLENTEAKLRLTKK